MGSRSNTQQSLPGWAVPTAQELLRSGVNLVAPGQAPPGATYNLAPLDPALYAQLAPFTPTQEAGLGAMKAAAAPSAELALSGAGSLEKTLSGDYLNPETNPYLKGTFDAASSGLVNQYRNATAPLGDVTAMQAGVAGGSGARQGQALKQFDLGQNLANLASQIYGGNFAQERTIQAAAPSQVGGLQQALAQPGQQLIGAGTLEQGQQQAALDIGTQNAQLKQQYPYTLQSYLSNLIGSVTSGGGAVSSGTSK